MVKLIAMDMDGTLLNPSQLISPGNLAALRAARQAGIRLCLCSGRMPEDASFFASDAGIDDMLILALNGAYCLDRPHGKVVSSREMARETAQRLAEAFEERGMVYSVFRGNEIVLSRKLTSPQELDQWGGSFKRHGKIRHFEGREQVERLAAEGINKFVCVDRAHPEGLQAFGRELGAAVPAVEITSSWVDNIEIMSQGVNKGTALSALAARLGIAREEIMAIGDNDNDRPMFRAAGVSVCMANGTEKAKAEALHLTASNAEDGVAQAIFALALPEKA